MPTAPPNQSTHAVPAPAPRNLDARELAAHISTMRRQWWTTGRSALTIDIPPDPPADGLADPTPDSPAPAPSIGWAGLDPTSDGQFPSNCPNRVWFIGAPRWPTPTEFDRTLALLRAQSVGHAFLFCDDADFPPTLHSHLLAAGCAPWDGAQSLVLLRRATPMPPPPLAPGYQVRHATPGDVAALTPSILGWFADADALARSASQPHSALFLAYAGDLPVAAGLLTISGAFAHLSAAGTAPEHRGRGCQSALIAARVNHAAARAAAWCTCETNEAVRTSLANLGRAGFARALTHRIYEWHDLG